MSMSVKMCVQQAVSNGQTYEQIKKDIKSNWTMSSINEALECLEELKGQCKKR